MSTFYLKPLDE